MNAVKTLMIGSNKIKCSTYSNVNVLLAYLNMSYIVILYIKECRCVTTLTIIKRNWFTRQIKGLPAHGKEEI